MAELNELGCFVVFFWTNKTGERPGPANEHAWSRLTKRGGFEVIHLTLIFVCEGMCSNEEASARPTWERKNRLHVCTCI